MKMDAIDYRVARETQPVATRPAPAARFGRLVWRLATSQGLIALCDQAIVSGTSFATAVIIGRNTSPDQLGLYYLTLSIVLILLGVQDQLIAAPYIIYSKRRAGRELAEFAGSSWVHHLAMTAVAIVMLLLGAAVLTAAGAVKLVPALWVLSWAAPLLLLREAIRRFAIADLRLSVALAIDAPVAALQIGGLLLLAYYGNLSVLTIFGTMAAACTLAALGWLFLRRHSLRFKRQRLLSDWWGNWSFSKWALRSYLVGNTTPYIMPWILNLAVSTAATGVLGACTTLVGGVNVFVSAVANVLTPRAAQAFVNGGNQELRRVLLRTALFLISTLGTMCVLLLFVGEQVAVLVYGEHFVGSGPIITALAFSALMNALGMVVGNGLWAIDQPRLNFVADIWCVLTTLAAAALLVFPLGALGAAFATLIGTSTGTVVRIGTLIKALEKYGAVGGAQPWKTNQS